MRKISFSALQYSSVFFDPRWHVHVGESGQGVKNDHHKMCLIVESDYLLLMNVTHAITPVMWSVLTDAGAAARRKPAKKACALRAGSIESRDF
jgi:hypothetical protein